MASREQLDALRELAVKRHRAASQKVSRNRRKGVVLENTKHDPRTVDPERFKKMNSIQLGAHIARLNKFISRETQFAPGARGQILAGDLWQRNKQLQHQINVKRERKFDSVKDIHIPSFGTVVIKGESVPATVENMQAMKPVHPVTGNPASRAPHIPVNISSKGIPNNKQLIKANKDLEAKASADYENKMIKRDRRIMSKFMKTIAKINKTAELKEIRSIYKDLTPGQFEFMWNYTKFSDISSFDYEIAKSKLHDPKSLSQFDAAFDTQIREMNRIIKEVKNLDL